MFEFPWFLDLKCSGLGILFFACIWKFKLLHILFDRKKKLDEGQARTSKNVIIFAYGDSMEYPSLGHLLGPWIGERHHLSTSLFFLTQKEEYIVLALLVFFIFFLLDK